MTRERNDQIKTLEQFNPWTATAGPLFEAGVKLTDTLCTQAIGVASELTDFTLLRIQEDVRLPERLARCKSPEDVQKTWVEYWKKAFDQHGSEWTKLAELNRAGLAPPATVGSRHSKHNTQAAA